MGVVFTTERTLPPGAARARAAGASHGRSHGPSYGASYAGARGRPRLPRRAALLRSGDASGVIYTLTTPPLLSGHDLERRIQTIVHQTRVTYCHPREEVERAFQTEQPVVERQPWTTAYEEEPHE